MGPHTAEMRYCSGSRLLELVATYCTVKSLSIKAPGEAEERQQQQQELAVGERPGRRHHAEATEMGPDQRVAPQQQGGGEGQDQ